jgi:hypothetical protein
MTLDSNSPNQSITKRIREMPNHRLVTLLSAAAIATTAGLAVPSPARAEDNQRFTIESYCIVVPPGAECTSDTGSPGHPPPMPIVHLCLQPVDESTEQGAAIVQMPCRENKGVPIPAQVWTRPPSDNIFHFTNSKSGLCLDARGGAANGTPVQQWTCNNISNENWQTGKPKNQLPPRYPSLISRVSGTSSHCLDMPGADPTVGHAIQIYRCNDSVAQDWNQLQVFPEG